MNPCRLLIQNDWPLVFTNGGFQFTVQFDTPIYPPWLTLMATNAAL